MIKNMQGVFYWGMKISLKEINLLSLNDYARKITVAPIGAEAIFFNISYEYDETKDNILKALNREE